MQVALYARVSTGRQAEKGLSIPDQLRSMHEWCTQQGHSVVAEYVDPGISATTEARPQLQRMIADSQLKPRPFDLVIVHSLSRFFRDHIQLSIYARTLKKNGVDFQSITQQTADDPSGEFMRSVYALFDEHQSKENAKHTLRSMRENARQGFWNGSRPPYGYRIIEAAEKGRHGKKKKLDVEQSEAIVVRKIFELYWRPESGSTMSMAKIAKWLTERGYNRRGLKWSKRAVADCLANAAYMGEHWFNRKCSKTRQCKPKTEWIRLTVPPIVSADLFESVQQKRASRSPEVVPPGRIGSPTLLTGILRCGHCSAAMTLATGKGGRYRYYKCTNRINNGPASCRATNIPMEKLDAAVLSALADEVCQTSRIKFMLKELKDGIKASKVDRMGRIPLLQKEMRDLEKRQDRLLEAIEMGVSVADDRLNQRMDRLEKRRQGLLVEIAGIRRRGELPIQNISGRTIETFSQVLRERLQDASKAFAKGYVNALIESVTVTGKQVHLSGNAMQMAGAILAGTKKAGHPEVPGFGAVWLPGPDSNQRPID